MGTERLASRQNSGSLHMKTGTYHLYQRQVRVQAVKIFLVSPQKRKLATFAKSLFFFAPRQQRNASSKKAAKEEEEEEQEEEEETEQIRAP